MKKLIQEAIIYAVVIMFLFVTRRIVKTVVTEIDARIKLGVYPPLAPPAPRPPTVSDRSATTASSAALPLSITACIQPETSNHGNGAIKPGTQPAGATTPPIKVTGPPGDPTNCG